MKRTISLKVIAWLNYILAALPVRTRITIAELICGCIAAASGHVTNAILNINNPSACWNTYYKMIQNGKFNWRSIAKNVLLLIEQTFQSQRVILAIDDTMVLRASEKAPGAGIHHNHASKINTKNFVLAQMFVSIFFIAKDANQRSHALPLCMLLAPKGGNTSKIKIAAALVRIAWRWLKNKKVLLLMDSWYMKGTLALPLLEKNEPEANIHCIGQVRRDTAIYTIPEKKQGRGRPRIYGDKITKENFHTMAPLQKKRILAYGEEREFSFYEFTAVAKFLKGRKCKAVWCCFEQKDKNANWRLIISTDTTLSAAEIIELYATRWAVEPAFNELKNTVGVNEAWQQKRKTADRWRCILCTACCISKLAAITFGEQLALLRPIDWRRGQPMTAGWAALALGLFLRTLSIRACWDRKEQKIILPD